MRKYLIIAGLFSALALSAQVSEKIFPKPSYFIKHFTTVPTKVELAPPVRLGDYVVDGKLELSLKSFLDLVMANDTDVSITKLSVETAQNNIVSALGAFDPSASLSFSATRQKQRSNNVTQGAAVLNSLSQPARLNVTQNLITGGSYTVSFSDTKSSSNAATSVFNPSYSAQPNFTFTQPLLRGRGSYYARMPVTIARSQLRASQYSLQDSVTSLVQTAINHYWSAVRAREQLKVDESALDLADQTLKRANREVELGATSPLDIYQNQSSYAQAQFNLSAGRYTLQQSEDQIRRDIGADLDPKFHDVPIVLTESVDMPSDPGPIDKEAMVTEAIANRPDLMATRQNLDVNELNLGKANNNMLPNLSLSMGYGSYGTGGTYISRQNVVLGDNTTSTITQIIPGGIGDALSQAFAFTYPSYTFSLTLTLPLRDRASAAALANALVTKKRDVLTVRQAEQNVRLNVLQAVSSVESAVESVKLAKAAVDIAQKQVDADQKKYDLGTEVMQFLLQSQNNLVQAQLQLANSLIGYQTAVLGLQRQTGGLLAKYNIVVQ